MTLEDPVESVVEGAAQAPIQPAAGFDFATGLRSLMRQDPEVLLVGEIRDRTTAEVAFQAALTEQLLLSSFGCRFNSTYPSRPDRMRMSAEI